MKKVLLLAGALVALTAAVANAQINLSWTDCGAAGVADKSFTCTANTGFQTLHGSYMSPAGTVGITGAEGVIDLQAAGSVLPPWWMFGTGNCRPTALTVAFNTACNSAVDYWGSIPGGALGGFGYYPGFGQPTRARIKTVCAVDGTAATALDGVSEYYAFSVKITNALSTGTGNCAGCSTPVCIVFNSLKLTQGAGIGDYLLVAPANSNFATWQGGAGVNCLGTPTQNRTWGGVKALYR